MSVGYIRSRVELKEVDFFDNFMLDSMIGQKITSQYKPLVYLKGSHVLKGPYDLRKRAPQIAQILFRHELFGTVWAGACPVAATLQLVAKRDAPNLLYFLMPHIGNAPTDAQPWTGTLETILGQEKQLVVASKESQGLIELSHYLDDNECDAKVVACSIIHFVHRYICDPIVGDAALRNVLVATELAQPTPFGIDYEENRTGDADKLRATESLDFISMIEGGKKWRHRTLLNNVAVEFRTFIRAHIENVIDAKWNDVNTLVTTHSLGTSVSVDNMKRRCAAVLRALASATRLEYEKRKAKSTIDAIEKKRRIKDEE